MTTLSRSGANLNATQLAGSWLQFVGRLAEDKAHHEQLLPASAVSAEH
jgi:hypothetical protein